MNIFNQPQEKGTSEWWSIGSILRRRRADLYPSQGQGVVHLQVRPGQAYHQQFFILKNARG